MGMKVEGVDALKFLIQQGGERAVKGAYKAMLEEAQEIVSLAKRQAPVDTGDLERSIKVKEIAAVRSSKGQFGRKSIEVGVDATTGRLSEYYYIVHEYYQFLGPRSQEKQNRDRSVFVGYKYLERAVDTVSKGMMRRIVTKVREELY
jgi:hypothetical protein